MQESELIASLKKGHEQAFEELVNLYKDRIYNTALGFVQNEEDAEEVTQDVFIKVYQHIKGFKEEAKLSTWLYRVAVTQSFDFLRKKKRLKRTGFVVSIFNSREEEISIPHFHHPGVVTEQKETTAILFEAIKKLPEQQQTVLLLQKLEGLSQQDVADIMKTTAAAVESLLHRARANLRKLLEDYYQKHYK